MAGSAQGRAFARLLARAVQKGVSGNAQTCPAHNRSLLDGRGSVGAAAARHGQEPA